MNGSDTDVEILYVEDNPHDAELTLRSLRKRNLANRIHHVEDGAAALEFIFGSGQGDSTREPFKPKVVLLDLKLPKLDGLEVLRALKEDSRTRCIPVVMLSSSQEDRDILESYHLGVNSYIVKPLDFDRYSEAVSLLGFYWAMLNTTPINLS